MDLAKNNQNKRTVRDIFLASSKSRTVVLRRKVLESVSQTRIGRFWGFLEHARMTATVVLVAFFLFSGFSDFVSAKLGFVRIISGKKYTVADFDRLPQKKLSSEKVFASRKKDFQTNSPASFEIRIPSKNNLEEVPTVSENGEVFGSADNSEATGGSKEVKEGSEKEDADNSSTEEKKDSEESKEVSDESRNSEAVLIPQVTEDESSEENQSVKEESDSEEIKEETDHPKEASFWENSARKILEVVSAEAGEIPPLKTTIIDPVGQEAEIFPEVFETEGGISLSLPAPGRSFRPGRYELKVEFLDGETVVSSEQDFTWGVLAINPNKSIYSPGEKGKLALAVLDEKGEMVCDAKLELKVKNEKSGEEDKLSTENEKIMVNEETCRSKDFAIKPDYEAEYEFGEEGEYFFELTATTANGTYSISDKVEVKNDVSFDVERITATRIYPPETYPVMLNIVAREDFKGKIEEAVPAGFDISEISENGYRNYDGQEEKGSTKLLSWEVDLKKGEKMKLGYTFKAPNISPQFYLLGSLRFYEDEKIVFEEARKWQVAADSIGSAYATRVYTAGFERNSVTANHEITGTSGTAPTISSSTYRSGSYAMRTNASSATSIAYWDLATADTGTTRTIARAYIRAASLPAAETVVLAFYDGTALGTAQASIRLNSSGDLKLYNEEDNTQIGSTLSGAVSTNTWYRLELKYDFGTAATGDTAVAGMIDGNIFASSTTENYANGTRRLGWGVITSTTGDLYWDDIGINQDATATVDNWVGEGKVVMLLPDGVNSSATPWDNNGGASLWQSVDDPASTGFDDATTYVDCSTNTSSSTNDFSLADTSSVGIGSGDQIRLVEGWTRGRSSTATASAHTATLVGTGTDAGAANSIASSSWWTNDDTVPRNSSVIAYDDAGSTNYTGLTPAQVDSMSLRLTTSDCSPEHQVTAVWALVEYVSEGGRLWSSGFELQNTPTNTEEWDSVTGTLDISTATKRSGDASGRVQSLSSGTEESVTQTFASSNGNGPYFFRTYLNIATFPATNTENRVFEFKDSGGTARAYLTLANSSDGTTQTLKLYDEDGQVGSASSDLATSQWYRVEVKYDSSGTGATDTVEARIDGTNFATSLTRDLTNGVTQIVLGGNLNGEAQTTGEWFFDDVALNQNSGSVQNGYPGEGKIVHLRPNANGDATAWTGTYADIDDTDPDEATTRAYISTVNSIEEAGITDSSTAGIGSNDTISLVSVGARFNTSASATMVFNVRLKDTSNAPVMKSGQIVSTGTTWYTNKNAAPRPYPITAYTRPFRSSSWTVSDLDSAQIGVQETVDTTSNIQVTALWALVEYQPAPGITVSGGCFTDDTEGTACTDDGSDQIKVAVNGTVDSGVDTTVDGSWSFTISQPSNGDILVFFRDGESTESEEATTVVKYDGSGNVDNVKLYQNQLVIGTDTGSANSDQTIANTDMDTATNGYENSDDEDVLVSVASDDLTLQSGNHLYVISGDTYRPGSGGGADVTVQNLYFEGTFTTDNNAVGVAGDFTNAGTFTASTSTITLNGTAAQTFTTNGATYNILTLNNTGTDGANDNITISGALDVNGNFSITNGDLVLTSGNPNINTAGDVAIGSSAFVTKGSGTWTFDGGTQALTDSSTGGPQDLGVVTIGPSTTTTLNTGSAVKVSSMTVGGNDTLNITDDTLYLTGTGDVLTVNTGGTFTQTGATVNFAGSSSQNIPALNYNNLTSSSSGARVLASSGTIGIAGTFTPGTNSYTVTGSTVDFNGSGTQTIPAFNYYNLRGGTTELAITNLDNGTTTSNPATTATLSPSSGSMLIVSVAAAVSSAPPGIGTLDISGCGLTWTQVDGQQWGARRDMFVWAGTGTPTSGTLTITYTPNAYTFQEMMYSVEQVTGFDSGSPYDTPVKNTAVGNLDLPDVGTPGSGDGIFSFFAHENADNNLDFTTGITELARESGGANVRQIITGYERDESMDETPGVTNDGGSNATGGIAFIVNSGSSGAGDRTLASSGTIGIAGTFTPGSNSYTVTGSTVDFNGSSTQTVNSGFTFNNLQVRPSANSVTTNFAAGTVTVGGNFTAGNGTNTSVTVSANANSTTLNVTGNFSISGNTTFSANGSNATSVGGNWSNSGSFTHNSGTVNFNGGNGSTQTFSGNTTFQNFSASASSSSGRTLAFTDGSTQTVSGTWTVAGVSGRVITLTRTGSSSNWTINPTNASVTYVAVDHSTNSGTSFCATYSTDNLNNIGWSITTGSSCSSNQNPSLPSNFTPAGYIDAAGWMTDNTPTFGFDLSDPDSGQQVKFEIQIDDTSGFSSPVVDYVSALASQGTFSFTVGQAAGGGTYTVGTQGQTLSDSASGGGYYWRAKAIDAAAAESAYEEAGVDNTIDFRLDATAPTGGTVYDGTTGDQDWNDGSLTQISGNWLSFNADSSGLQKYEYAIRRQSDGYYWDGDSWETGATWTDQGTSTSVTVNSMNLQTGIVYYVSVRATDNAGNVGGSVDSNGQQVTPELSFSLGSNSAAFDNLNVSNSWTDTVTGTTTVSTNASSGYTIKAYEIQPLTSSAYPAVTVPDFSGTWADPLVWNAGTYGFGYTSSDTNVQGSNRFNGGTEYTAFSSSSPGDVVADHTDAVNGTTGKVSNEQFTITYKVSTSNVQAASDYRSYVVYVVTANY